MPSGGYTPPPGGYTPPPSGQGQGSYTPPPQGGYVPPQGGYTPPPPPPQGGYAPPPGQGGYGAPPQPPPGDFKVDMNQMKSTNFQGLFQKYMNALTKPNVSTYEAEIPQANWNAVLIGVGIVTVVSLLLGLLRALLFPAVVNPLGNQFGSDANMSAITNMASGATVGSALFGIIFTPLLFFCGAGILWLTARMFGGTGSNFMTHCYLLSLSYTPTRVIAAVLNFIPVLGLISFIVILYQFYLAGLALQASQRMQPGRAQMAAWIPLLVGILLFCLMTVACAGLLASALGNIR